MCLRYLLGNADYGIDIDLQEEEKGIVTEEGLRNVEEKIEISNVALRRLELTQRPQFVNDKLSTKLTLVCKNLAWSTPNIWYVMVNILV